MFKEEFIIKVKELGLVLTDKELHSLDRYYQILKEENSKYNLTRIIEEEEVYLKHFYDSLTITKVVNIDNRSICDLGSGAGFPEPLRVLFHLRRDQAARRRSCLR